MCLCLWKNGKCTECEYACKHPNPPADDGDCTTAVVCPVCEKALTEANTAHTVNSRKSNGNGTHTGKCTVSGCDKEITESCSGGTACVSGENSISLTNLSGESAKDIYIVVKNAAGSASETLKIEIPAYEATYVEPVYSISADVSALDFGSVQAGYASPGAKTVTVTNTGNQQISLTQPAANNYAIGNLSKTVLEPNETATFTVRPKYGLAANAYGETITIHGTGASDIGIRLSFTVSESVKPGHKGTEDDNTNEYSQKDVTIPLTGDSGHTFLWPALMFVIGGAVMATAVGRRKKRAK